MKITLSSSLLAAALLAVPAHAAVTVLSPGTSQDLGAISSSDVIIAGSVVLNNYANVPIGGIETWTLSYTIGIGGEDIIQFDHTATFNDIPPASPVTPTISFDIGIAGGQQTNTITANQLAALTDSPTAAGSVNAIPYSTTSSTILTNSPFVSGSFTIMPEETVITSGPTSSVSSSSNLAFSYTTIPEPGTTLLGGLALLTLLNRRR